MEMQPQVDGSSVRFCEGQKKGAPMNQGSGASRQVVLESVQNPGFHNSGVWLCLDPFSWSALIGFSPSS